MNIPRLPTRFRQGEVLTAEKLNALLDWMEAVQGVLPGLRVRTSNGGGLTYAQTSTGTILSLSRGFAQGSKAAEAYEHPFKVAAAWVKNSSGEKVLAVSVASGGVVNTLKVTSSNNFVTHNDVVASARFEFPAGTESVTMLYVCPLVKRETEGATFLTPAPDTAGYITPATQLNESGKCLTINLASIEASAERGSVKVTQLWRSDIIIPAIL